MLDDICFTLYREHRQTRSLKVILWYSGWLSCGSLLMYPHLPEQVPQQFDYLQGIPRDLILAAPNTILHRDIDAMIVDYHEHHATKYVCSVSNPRLRSIIYIHIQWFKECPILA